MPKVTVEGTVMSINEKEKDGKRLRTAYLYQEGETIMLKVRLASITPKIGELVKIKGRLLFWNSKSGNDCMVMAEA